MWRHRKPPPPPLSAAPPHMTSDEELERARQARKESTAHFFGAIDDNVEVRKLVSEMKEKRTRNNWGPMLGEAMRRK